MRVAIIGGSGFAGGTLLQLLLQHPKVEITLVTSRSLVGKYVHMVHPNLKSISKNLKFELLKVEDVKAKCDLAFTAVPHGASMEIVPDLLSAGLKVIDLSADFRIKDATIYQHYYSAHKNPEVIKKAVYGIPELHRKEIKTANLIACPGCHASSGIFALAPLVKEGLIETHNIIIDSKTGSSGAGHEVSEDTHHPFREGSIRPYAMTGHRHTAEIEQELQFVMDGKYTIDPPKVRVGFSAHGDNIIRGILSTCHAFIKPGLELDDKIITKAYRQFYKDEPFVRFVKQVTGIYRLPDPKLIAGTNYVDIGFELDVHIKRIVALCALDNLVKGAAGSAVQCMNIIGGFDETTGLMFPGLFP
jgi:N-acetyl-gamma-glutamyl-phosphate/LysW-gamma-L-alpha-aminoadipyl-6-phosphate reductase